MTVGCLSLLECHAQHSHCSVVTIFGLKTADCRNLNLKAVPRTLPAVHKENYAMFCYYNSIIIQNKVLLLLSFHVRKFHG
jgi:hypothetical protein